MEDNRVCANDRTTTDMAESAGPRTRTGLQQYVVVRWILSGM